MAYLYGFLAFASFAAFIVLAWFAENAAPWIPVHRLLRKWSRDPGSCVDADAVPPTPEALAGARAILPVLRRTRTVPSGVCPDNNGGVCFEWVEGERSEWVEVSPEGVAEVLFFNGGVLMYRRPFI